MLSRLELQQHSIFQQRRPDDRSHPIHEEPRPIYQAESRVSGQFARGLSDCVRLPACFTSGRPTIFAPNLTRMDCLYRTMRRRRRRQSQSVTGQPSSIYISQMDRTDRDYAAFTDVTYDITDKLKMAAGSASFGSRMACMGFSAFSPMRRNAIQGMRLMQRECRLSIRSPETGLASIPTPKWSRTAKRIVSTSVSDRSGPDGLHHLLDRLSSGRCQQNHYCGAVSGRYAHQL